MKKIAIFYLLVLLVSCTEEVVNLQYSDGLGYNVTSEYLTKSMAPTDSFDLEDYPYTFYEDSLFIESLGEIIVTMEEVGDRYIINNEFVYLKSILLKQRNMPQNRLIGTTINEEYQHIYLDIVEYSPVNEIEFVYQAIEEWNSIEDCNIYFTYYNGPNSNNYGVVSRLTIGTYNEYPYWNGWVYPYVDTRPGYPCYEVLVNYSERYTALDDDDKVYMMMHALGHMIGLKDEELDGTHLPGTASFDSYSIMRSYDYTIASSNPWIGFSEQDQSGLASLYPLKPKSMSMSLYHSSQKIYTGEECMAVMSYESLKPIPGASYEYEVTGPSECEVNTNGKDTCRFTFSEPGTYMLHVTLKGRDGIVRYEYEDTIDVYKKSIDKVTCPSFVSFNESFVIGWEYSDSSFAGEYVDFLVSEKYFSFNTSLTPIQPGPRILVSTGINTVRLSDTSMEVTIKDTGYYVIEATAADSGKKLEFHFALYDYPFITIDDPLDFKETVLWFPDEEAIMQSDVTLSSSAVPLNYTAQIIRKGTESVGNPKRLVLLLKENYYGLSEEPALMTCLYTSVDTLLVKNKQATSISLPPTYYDTSAVSGFKWYGYYTISIPEPVCRYEKKY